MLDGEKRIKRIEQDLGRQIIGRVYINVLEKSNGRRISRKEFNKIVGRTIRLDRIDSKQILNVLKYSRKAKITQRRIKLI